MLHNILSLSKGGITMRIVALANHKGGVSKTTTAWALGSGLRNKGYKVLLIDLDPQSNLSFTAGIDLLNVDASMYDVFKETTDINDCLYQIFDDTEDFDIIVGSINLVKADREFIGVKAPYMLRNALKNLAKTYDFCIIDTPPILGTLTENALTACDDLIIPMKADVYSLQGLENLTDFIAEQREYTNKNLNVSGILLTCVNERTNLTKGLLESFKKKSKGFGTKLFNTRIHNSVAVQESALNMTTIYKHAPNATATKDYEKFVEEYLKGIKKNGTKA